MSRILARVRKLGNPTLDDLHAPAQSVAEWVFCWATDEYVLNDRAVARGLVDGHERGDGRAERPGSLVSPGPT
jgi:hypothetical protein